MNDSQQGGIAFALLPAFEKAARIYCANIGVDPDVEVPTPHPVIKGVMLNRKFWEIQAERMADLGLMLSAMKNCGEASNDARIKH